VETSVSNLWIWVVAVLYNYRDHDRNLLRVVNVLTDLAEGHNAGIFISPVRIVGNCVLDQLADKRQHNFVTDTRHKAVNTAFTEVDVIFLFILVKLETFLGSEPAFLNIFVDVYHESENLVQDVLEQIHVLLGYRGLSLKQRYHKFKGLVADLIVCKFLVLDNWPYLLINFFEDWLEKCGFDFCQLVEFNKSVF